LEDIECELGSVHVKRYLLEWRNGHGVPDQGFAELPIPSHRGNGDFHINAGPLFFK